VAWAGGTAAGAAGVAAGAGGAAAGAVVAVEATGALACPVLDMFCDCAAVVVAVGRREIYYSH
jgi:hypothetical protein